MIVRLAFVLLAACATERTPVAWDWQLPAHIPAPRVPADNPMAIDKVELGRHLFHDPRLSSTGTQSCATCHIQARAFTDGRVTPLGATGEPGVHNAMSLANVAYNSSSTWAHHVIRLEDQALGPMFGTAPVEMAASEPAVLALLRAEPVYAELFPRAFPDDVDPFTIANVTRAIASFERTILSASTRFDRFLAGDGAALDDAERRGLALFDSDRLSCARCHGGFNLASAYDHEGMPDGGQVQLFNTGLYNVDGRGAYPAGDRGLIEVTGDPQHMGRFRAPTLRNITLTAPYFHDGSAATLDDVIDSYARGGRLVTGAHAGDGATSPLKSPFVSGFELTAGERADLHAFFDALTDHALLADPVFASPWQK